jgi:hypothetical protein
LSDTIATSDVFATLSGFLFDAVDREILTSGGTVTPVAFDALTREVLISADNSSSTDVIVSGVVREILVGLKNSFINIEVPNAFGPIPVFPALPEGFPIKVSLVLDTTIGTTKSLREMRVAQQLYPLWDIEVLFQELRDQTQNQSPYGPFLGFMQYMELVQQWLMMYGQTGVFAFDCPWDDSRSNQIIGQGDGITTTFNIYRTWGTGANATAAPVGLVNNVTQVQVNGITVPTAHYSIGRDQIFFADAEGNSYPPGAGLDITMTFTFYYLCRFVEDQQDFEEFSKNRWTVPSLKFRAVIWQ